MANRGTAVTSKGVVVELVLPGAAGGMRAPLRLRATVSRALAPGGVPAKVVYRLDKGSPLGARICATVDPDGAVSESDLSNNTLCARVDTRSGRARAVAGRPAVSLASLLETLPLTRASLEALSAGQRRRYVLVRLGADGSLRSRERVSALAGAWVPRPADMRPARAYLQGADGVRVPAGEWYWSDSGHLWLPLTGQGRVMGILAVSERGDLRVTLDADGDGVADLVLRESLASGEAALLFPEGEEWNALVRNLMDRQGVCAAARAAGLTGARAGGTGAGGGGLQGTGFAMGVPRLRLPVCGRAAPGGGAGAGGMRNGLGNDERCAALLRQTGASPAERIPSTVRSERGSSRNLRRNVRELVVGLVCPICGWAIAGSKIASAFERGGATLRGVVKEVASAGSPHMAVTFVVGDYLSERGREAKRESYVNSADETLHDMERFCGDAGPDECARTKGAVPDWRTVRRACSAGSSSAYCDDPKWSQPPSQRTRPSRPVGKPLPDSDVEAPSLDALMARSCLERAKYLARVRGSLLGPVEEECEDPRSQPVPAQEARAAARRDAPVRMRSYCTGDGQSETRAPTEQLADLIGERRCPANPTERPDEGDGRPGGKPCLRGAVYGFGAGRGGIGIAYGVVVGIGPCPEELCDPSAAARH